MADTLGEDFSGVDDMEPSLQVVGGRDGLLEALARRLSTRSGGLWYDRTYGYDLRRFIGSTVSERVIARAVETECLKDERVQNVRAAATRTKTGGHSAEALTIEVLVTDDRGTFSGTIVVGPDAETDDLTVSVLNLAA